MADDMWWGRPLWAEVDLDAIAHNIRQIKQRVPNSRLLAVVKANAYGHGAVPVARQVLEAGAEWLGVACVDEGIQLRQAGIAARVLILGYNPPWEADRIIQWDLTPTVTNQQLALALASVVSGRRDPFPVHIKIDTGMGRLGVRPEEAPEFIRFLEDLPGISIEGLYTHFAVADEADKTFTWRQFESFMSVARRFPDISIRHVANSAAILDLPEMALDMVRPGISLYGLYPSDQVSRSLDLRPALSLKSRVARLHWLRAGDTVSYGRTWTAEQPTHVALIPCGYADGLQRVLSNRAAVLVRGRRAPVLGRICMDQCIVDVTGIDGLAVEDEVTIIGEQDGTQIDADEVARLAGTISYEILCGISARVPRVYFQAGQVAAASTLIESVLAEPPTTSVTPPV